MTLSSPTERDWRRITLWMDLQQQLLRSGIIDTGKQARGEVVKPTLATPPWMDFDGLAR